MRTHYLYYRHFFSITLCILALTLFSPPANAGATESGTCPQRVVSLGPIITKTIYLLEADQHLIANTTYCTLPPDARKKEKIGTLIQMNVEKILSLKPDLVLANALTKQKQILLLKKMGVRVITFENAKTFSDMCAMTLKLGKLLGKEKNAREVIDRARQEVDAIRMITKQRPKRRVFIQIGMKPLHTSVKDTFVNEYIEFAGGTNIAANEKTGVYSREKVLQQNPDVILIATMGNAQAAAKDERKGWMRFQSIPAARNNEIHILDSDIICSPTPVTFIKGLKSIALKLHPGIGL